MMMMMATTTTMSEDDEEAMGGHAAAAPSAAAAAGGRGVGGVVGGGASGASGPGGMNTIDMAVAVGNGGGGGSGGGLSPGLSPGVGAGTAGSPGIISGVGVGVGGSNSNNPNQSNSNSKRGARSDAAEWSENAIAGLLEAFGARYIASHRGNLRSKDWAEVTRAVNASGGVNVAKSVEQCRNKIDNLKKRFKLEREKGSPSTWPWFRTLDNIVGRAPKRAGAIDASSAPPASPSPTAVHHHRGGAEQQQQQNHHPHPLDVRLSLPGIEMLHQQQQHQLEQLELTTPHHHHHHHHHHHNNQRGGGVGPLVVGMGMGGMGEMGGDEAQDDTDPENVGETPYSSQRDSHTDFGPFKGGVGGGGGGGGGGGLGNHHHHGMDGNGQGNGKDVMSEMTNPEVNANDGSNEGVGGGGSGAGGGGGGGMDGSGGGGGGGGGKGNRKKRKNNVCQMGRDVAASISSFADVFAKIEFAKMELFKDVEMRRIEMQYKLAKMAQSRKKSRANSVSSASE